ncbi:MAG: plasma-membrane proton-efflux P-type ATPase [Minisyncoccia bacterium]
MDQKFKGLTETEANNRLKHFGFNELPQEKKSLLIKFIHSLYSPIFLMLVLAIGLSLLNKNIDDAIFIAILLIINLAVQIWHEYKSDNIIQQLNNKLTTEILVTRNNKTYFINSKYLVPGDLITLNSGDIVPADIKIIYTNDLSINTAALTGESLPQSKKINSIVYSGSFVVQGMAQAIVLATGKNTYFNKNVISIEVKRKTSLLEKDILSIAKLLSIISIITVIVITFIFLIYHYQLKELLVLDLSLFIAGIPVSLPTILSLIISIGVLSLSKQNTIIRRLSSLEDFANVNLLLTDKTGTLTKNKITVEKIIPYNYFTEEDVIRYGFWGTSLNTKNPIENAIIQKTQEFDIKNKPQIIKTILFDSTRKRSTSIVKYQNQLITISIGAPQVIKTLCNLNTDLNTKLENDIKNFALNGYRPLAVAIGSEEKNMKLVGIMLLSDQLLEDAKNTIQFMQDKDINIKILTGDNFFVAQRITRALNIPGRILNRQDLEKIDWSTITPQWFNSIATFSEILPADKKNIVQFAQKYNIVAVTGDGINDLLALKSADVGIAVHNAVDVLKNSADIVLLSDGLAVIKNAIIESRKIFHRLYTYSVYRISESFRLIISIALLGILFRYYPITPLQILLLAILNDIPIISLAYNKVDDINKPASINVKERIIYSLTFGIIGIINSFLLFFFFNNILKYPLAITQTLFFLKLSIGGHLLIYVAHTKKKWFKNLPSKQVIIATTLTQILASFFALTGIFLHKISLPLVIFIWIWAIIWMQITEISKQTIKKLN